MLTPPLLTRLAEPLTRLTLLTADLSLAALADEAYPRGVGCERCWPSRGLDAGANSLAHSHRHAARSRPHRPRRGGAR
jgi:hypothetical protein